MDQTVQLSVAAKSLGHYHVVVCGGGPAGTAAAIAAARSGVRTLLVDANGALGGMGTNAGVTVFLGGMKARDVWAVGGIYKEAAERLMADGFACKPGAERGELASFGHQGLYFDVEAYKRLLDDMVVAAGVDLIYFTTALYPKVENGRVSGVFLANKDGLTFAGADVVIDCTGDADIAFRAGFATVKGRSTGGMTAATLVSFYSHMDLAAAEEYLTSAQAEKDPLPAKRWKRLVAELKAQGAWTWPEEVIIMTPNMDPTVYYNNTSRQIGVDGTDPRSLTQAMIFGRRHAWEFLQKVVRPHFPGGQKAVLERTFPIMGIRETRKIVGEYTLTDDDESEGRHFDDVIGLAAHGFDLPDPLRPSRQPYFSVFWGKDKRLARGFCEIPYRCLVPKGSHNLLVAGRCLSAKDLALGPVREMPPSYGMGHAAGVAAAMCARGGYGVRDVPIGDVQTKLREQGAILE